MNDRTLGKVLLTLTTIFIFYYIFWIGISPFIDRSHFTQDLFPPREYGLLLSSLIMVGGMGITITVAAVHTIKQTGYHPELITNNSNTINSNENNNILSNCITNNSGSTDYLNIVSNSNLNERITSNGEDVPVKTLLPHLERNQEK